MKIAYRRMSGKIGVSEKEQGTRGLWWEKRRSLVAYLVSRGHKVDFCSDMTKHSQFVETIKDPSKHEMLIIEFGSSNKSFYGKDLERTIQICNEFEGPKVFLNDDPDLPFLWKEIKNANDQWTCWYNAVKPEPLGSQPWVVRSYDMPFSSLMEPIEPTDGYFKENFVYIGRANSRSKIVKYLIANRAPWKVYGRKEEWADFGIFPSDPPNQPQRAEFYHKQLGCLALADVKHKNMGWRTGRAYHAIMAGCPSLVEYDHIHLPGFPKFRSVEDINKFLHRWRDPEFRKKDWDSQIGHMWSEREIANKTLVAHGL